MTRNPTYPLESLREHRDRRVEAATLQLAEAIRRREVAAAEKAAAEEESKAAAERGSALRIREVSRLEGGGMRAGDLAAVEAWERSAAAEAEALASAVVAADRRLASARDDEDAARAALARASADLEVVVKDRAEFALRGLRAAEDAEAESAEEAAAARRRRP